MAKQINALTSTRGIAALMVVIFHFGRFCFSSGKLPLFFYHGALAVGYFFVLSGFVLYITYEGRKLTYGSYLKKRIARIVPVYEVALLLVVCVNFFIYRNSFSVPYIRHIVIHALLLQSYIPDYAIDLNIQAWTLSVEMCFYILFPLWLALFKQRTKLFFVLTIVLYAASQVAHLHYYPLRHDLSSNIIDTVFFSPVIHMNQFLIGMCGGYLYKKGSFRTSHSWLLPVSALLVLLLMCLLPPAISCHTGLIAPVFMLLIVSISLANPAILNLRPLIFIGEISYGIYILQMPIGEIFGSVNDKYLHLQARGSFFCFIGVLILTAAASFYLLEKPIVKKFSQPKRKLVIEALLPGTEVY